MKKIKITLPSGVLEKPVITAFKGTYGDYIVLDNETVGSMGLPVILISKIQDNKLMTIADANEWNAVKENLRNIIAGNQIVKVMISDEYTGDDIYYKQLTLPVASFEALKATFSEDTLGGDTPVAPAAPVGQTAPMGPAGPIADTNPVPPMPEAPTAPVEPASPVAPQAPEVTPYTVPSPEMPANVNPESVSPEQVTPAAPMGPAMPNVPNPMEPPVAPMPDAPVAPTAPVEPAAPVSPVAPATPEPTVEPIPPMPETGLNNNDFAADKEAFLKACENMFDALVAKFNK